MVAIGSIEPYKSAEDENGVLLPYIFNVRSVVLAHSIEIDFTLPADTVVTIPDFFHRVREDLYRFWQYFQRKLRKSNS